MRGEHRWEPQEDGSRFGSAKHRSWGWMRLTAAAIVERVNHTLAVVVRLARSGLHGVNGGIGQRR